MTGKLIMLALALVLGGTGTGSDTAGILEYAVRTAVWQQEESAKGTDPDAPAGEDPLLILVNKDHPLPDDYQVELRGAPYGSCNVSAEMYPALKNMLDDGQQEGLRFVVASGYRSANYQQGLLDEDIDDFMARGMSYEEAYEEATKDTMPAGHSEHSTGLAVDIVSASYQMLNDGLESMPEIQWLQAHCAEYGFILRYPKGKEDITKIVYESWHFRYVGTEAAKEITERGITLEEYVEEPKESENPENSGDDLTDGQSGWEFPGPEQIWIVKTGKRFYLDFLESFGTELKKQFGSWQGVFIYGRR